MVHPIKIMPGLSAHSRGRVLTIAFLITRSDTIGGAHVHVRDVATALKKEGHQVSVLVGGKGMYVHHLKERGIEVHCIPSLGRPISPYRDARSIGELRCALSLIEPDLVSTHSSKAGWLGRLVARSMGVPVLFTAHGWSFASGVPQPTRSIYGIAEAIASRMASSIVTVCDHDRRLAERWRIVPPNRVRTIHNGVTDVPPEQRAQPANTPPRIIMTARFDAPKDHYTLLRALAGIRGVLYGVDFIGDGPTLESVRDFASSCGLLPHVRFLGERTEVAPCLAQAQIFALISAWEGFPRSILEAMRAGLPVVATDVGGVSEAVIPNETGLLVGRRDVEGLRAHLYRLLTSPTLRAFMGDAGRRRYERNFTFECLLSNTLRIYHSLVAPGPGV